ncbi:phage gp6-like head-tail connector protein, partial [Escherichia coli]|nr:phage gp6-like head-tail connector protein [Escherichia coli]
MILSIEEIKRQLKLEEDDSSENTLLSALGAAAEARSSTFLNRNLYDKGESIPETDKDG